MNSSFSLLSGSLLEMLSEILDMQEQLHTASIEYTVMRENNLPIGFIVTIRCLLAEQKHPAKSQSTEKDVKFAKFRGETNV